MRPDAKIAEKFKECVVETDNRTDPLGNGGEHIVDDVFSLGPTKITESPQQSPVQRSLILTRSERSGFLMIDLLFEHSIASLP